MPDNALNVSPLRRLSATTQEYILAIANLQAELDAAEAQITDRDATIEALRSELCAALAAGAQKPQEAS